MKAEYCSALFSGNLVALATRTIQPDRWRAAGVIQWPRERHTMANFRFTVNGQARSVESEPDRPLLEVLREDLGLTGTKYGCGEGQCRACTVLLDGVPVSSCITPLKTAAGRQVRTIESLESNGKLHPVQQAFVDEGAMQCGYCTPGMILRTVALLEKTPKPTQAQIADGLNGSLCRCCGYPRIIAAVERAAAVVAETKGGRPRA
jgi:aerobic-type carbon monoxide dehydrogenase small subunit (CoxS/CutS family)